METLVTVLFGPPGAAVGWVSEEELPQLPPVGIPVRIRVHSHDGDEETIEGQVFRSWDEDGSDPGGILIYGGIHIPDVSVRNVLEEAGWEALSEDAAALLAGTIHESPVIAAKHEVNFFVGEGGGVSLYRQIIQPTSPILPLFGQRMRMNFVEADMDSGLEFFDETAWDLNDVSPLTEGEEDDDDEITDDDWRRMQEEDREIVDSDILSGCPGDVAAEGLPLIVMYSSLVEPGLARLGFWTSSLGNLTELDLLAVGWEKVEVPSRFDPEEFNLQRRIELALATHVVFESNNYDSIRVRDWWLDVPGLVDETDQEYLPPYLYQWAMGAQQVDSIDDLVKQWSQSAES